MKFRFLLLVVLFAALAAPGFVLAGIGEDGGDPVSVLTPESLQALAAIALSLIFSYIPGVSSWYGPLSSQGKALIMGALMLLVAGGSIALQCLGLYETGVVCSQIGIMDVVFVFLQALGANQATHMITKHMKVEVD